MTVDPTYGYTLARLHEVPAPVGPPDFADFWRRTYDEARSAPLHLTHRRVPCGDPGFELHEVEYDSLGGVRIGGWLAVPADGRFVRGVVSGHGYGGRQEPDLRPPGPPAVTISPCARGFDRSAHPVIPGVSGEHVLHGIGSRETYSHRGCAADLWRGASALLELFPEAGQALHYRGASFGGGIGALALPWDSRFHRAFLDVPSFGNHPLRVTLPCQGSGQQVRRHHRNHPGVLDVLAYFDAATAARHLQMPTFVAAALADAAVPPPGQFAVFNALTCERTLFVRQTGHPDTPEDDVRLHALLEDWFAR